MTTQQKLVQKKLSLLELGEYLQNVSEACRSTCRCDTARKYLGAQFHPHSVSISAVYSDTVLKVVISSNKGSQSSPAACDWLVCGVVSVERDRLWPAEGARTQFA